MLDPWRLKLLGDLAALGTVRAVAQAAHLSPSTVSQQLAVLEREAGARLFERAGRRLRLTDAGEILARHARTILDQMETARAEIAGDPSAPAGRLTIGAFTSAVTTFVLAAVHRLQAEHPRLRVDLRELDPTEGIPALRRGACDIAVTADLVDGGAPVDADILHTPLATDRVVLVTAAGTVLDGVDLADYARYRWSAERPGTWTHDLITRAGRRAGFEPDLTALFASYGPLLAHVEAGLSVTLLPELAVDARYNVTAHPLREPLERHITAAVRASAATRPSIAAALAALAAASSAAA